MVYLFIARYVLSYISMFSFRMIGIRMSAAIRLAYLQALFSQSIAVLDTLPPGQTASTITTTANTLQIGISEKLAIFLQFTSLMIGAVIIAFKYSWSLTLVTSSVLLFISLTYGIIVPLLVKMMKEVEHADGKASAIASETFGSIRMVAACGAEERMAKRYSRWTQESRRRGLKLSPVIGVQFSPGESRRSQ
jgi:ABC-type multidrug transport system fused ATPase/permease subunit